MNFKQDGTIILKTEQIITPNQTATVESFFDMALHSELSFGGGQVTANIVDYEGKPNPYTGQVTFAYDGQTVTVQAVNGTASISFTAPAGTEHTVRTANADMRNGEVTFLA